MAAQPDPHSAVSLSHKASLEQRLRLMEADRNLWRRKAERRARLLQEAHRSMRILNSHLSGLAAELAEMSRDVADIEAAVHLSATHTGRLADNVKEEIGGRDAGR